MSWIKKILFQASFVIATGVGTIVLIDPVLSITNQLLTTTILKFIGGIAFIGLGIYLASRYGKEYGVCK